MMSMQPGEPERLTHEVIGVVDTLLGVAAATWGVIMAVAPIMQIRRMIIRRSSGDLSLGYFGVLLPGFTLWVAYGWTRADWALVIPNTLALTIGVITVIVGLKLRPSRRPAGVVRRAGRAEGRRGRPA